MKETHKLRICMLLEQFEATVEYCRAHRSLLRTLVLLQMLPSATESPQSVIHFSVFEFAMFAKLDGGMSNHAITKVLNGYNMQKRKYNHSISKPPRTSSTIYRNLKRHAFEMLQEDLNIDLRVKCDGCKGSPRKEIVMDGNFSFKRKANAKIQEYREGIFAPNKAEMAMHGLKEEVDRFDKKADESEAKEEDCLVNESDSSFKAGSSSNRKKGERFDENDVFAVSCARHGCVERTFDIYQGEGHKYDVAAVDHVVKNMHPDQKHILIMYDIACLTEKRMEISSSNVQDILCQL